jgi:hypothetical protein
MRNRLDYAIYDHFHSAPMQTVSHQSRDSLSLTVSGHFETSTKPTACEVEKYRIA